MRQYWTPTRLLLNWGLIHSMGRLQDVLRKEPDRESSGEEGVDHELLAYDYVCRCAGYFKALPVLRFVYVYHGNPRHFDPTLPGESLSGALRRLEWPLLEGLPMRVIGPAILDEFVKQLSDRCKREPLVYHAPVEEHVLPLQRAYA